MKSQAYFENISKHIKNELHKSSTSIKLAVAWVTDANLFLILCNKAAAGVDVEILIANSDINFDSGIEFYKLRQNGGKIHWIGKNAAYAPLMHNKFCIIDNKTLIFGSYNWTKKARSNHESITIIEGDEKLILDFNQEFDKIKNEYLKPEDIQLDWSKIVLRLDTVSNIIKLEDEEDIKYQVDKLKSLIPKKYEGNDIKDLEQIIQYCKEGKYSKAIILIEGISSKYKKISIYQDPEIPALQLEIRGLEYQVSSLEDEKIEIEKLIHNFQERYNRELGEIIKEILQLKEKIAEQAFNDNKNDPSAKEAYEEAKDDYEQFNQSYQKNIKQEQPKQLSGNDLDKLKKLYREATKLCHPDKVAEEQKEAAEKVFKELRNAYEQNNLEVIRSILDDLQKGIFKSRGETITQKDKLQLILKELQYKRETLEKIILSLKGSEIFNKIPKYEEWDKYFKDQKVNFEIVLKELKKSNNETTVI